MDLHRTLGHASVGYMQSQVRNGQVEVPSKVHKDALLGLKTLSCPDCALAKASRTPLPSTSSPPALKNPLVWHADLKGPLVKSVGGARYLLGLIHAVTGFCFLDYLKTKSDTPSRLPPLVDRANGRANEAGGRFNVGVLRTDYGTEFVGTSTQDWLRTNGIRPELTSPDSSSQNGMAERKWRTLTENATASLHHSGLPTRYWAEAFAATNYVWNRMPSASRGMTSPYELFFGKPPDLSILVPFGCAAYARIPDELRVKRNLAGRARICIFLGYDELTKDGYKLLNLDTRRIIHSRSVRFLPNVFPCRAEAAAGTPLPPTLEALDEDSDVEQASASPKPAASDPSTSTTAAQDLATTEAAAPHLPRPALQPLPPALGGADAARQLHFELLRSKLTSEEVDGSRRSTRTTARPFTFDPMAYDNARRVERAFLTQAIEEESMKANGSSRDPSTFAEALASPERAQWIEGMKKELQNHRRNQTWRYSRKPQDRTLIGSRFVFKTKRGPQGEVLQYKVRLVAQGFRQREGTDYKETFSPCPRWSTIRFLLAHATLRDLEVHHMDVDAAYLIPELPSSETIYMRPPSGFPPLPAGYDCLQLRKCLYGLKQSGRHWHSHIHGTLIKMGFEQSDADPCLYIRPSDGSSVCLYVDDLILAAPAAAMESIKNTLKDHYSIKDHGTLSWYLGCSVDHNRSAGTLSLSQPAYVQEILQRANMADCKPVSTPITDRLYAPESAPAQEELDALKDIPFRETLGALLYLAVCSRPDIAFAVNQLSRHASNPRLVHWSAAKRVLRYLKGTASLGLIYKKADAQFSLLGFGDSDYAGDLATRRSTTGFVFVLAGAAISWRVQTQRCVALSSAEAELVALTRTVQEAAWLTRLAKCFGIQVKPLTIYEDNQAAIVLSRDYKFSEKTKHMSTRYFYVRERVADGSIVIEYISTTDQLADFFTKALGRLLFCKFRARIGMVHVKPR